MKILVIGYDKLKCPVLKKLWTNAISGTIGNNELKIFTNDIHSFLNNGIPEKFFTDKNFDNADIYVNFDHPSNISKEIPKEAVRIGYLGHLKVKKDLEEIRKLEYDAFFTELLPEELPIDLPQELTSFFNAKSITLPIPQSVKSISKFQDSSAPKKVTFIYDSGETSVHDSNEKQSKYSFKSILPVFKNIEHFQVFDVANENLDNEYINKAISQSSAIIMHNLSHGLASYISIISVNAKVQPIFWEKTLVSPFRFPSHSINGARLVKSKISDFRSLREAISQIINLKQKDTVDILESIKLSNSYHIIKQTKPPALEDDSFWKTITLINENESDGYTNTFDAWTLNLKDFISHWDSLKNSQEKEQFTPFISDSFAMFCDKYMDQINLKDWLDTYNHFKNEIPHFSDFYRLMVENDYYNPLSNEKRKLHQLWFYAVENDWDSAEKEIENRLSKGIQNNAPYYRFVHANWVSKKYSWNFLNFENAQLNIGLLEKIVSWIFKDIELELDQKITLPGVSPLDHEAFICMVLILSGKIEDAKPLIEKCSKHKWQRKLHFAFLLWTRGEIEYARYLLDEVNSSQIPVNNPESFQYLTHEISLSYLLGEDIRAETSLTKLRENFSEIFLDVNVPESILGNIPFLQLALANSKIKKQNYLKDYFNKHPHLLNSNDKVYEYLCNHALVS